MYVKQFELVPISNKHLETPVVSDLASNLCISHEITRGAVCTQFSTASADSICNRL